MPCTHGKQRSHVFSVSVCSRCCTVCAYYGLFVPVLYQKQNVFLQRLQVISQVIYDLLLVWVNLCVEFYDLCVEFCKKKKIAFSFSAYRNQYTIFKYNFWRQQSLALVCAVVLKTMEYNLGSAVLCTLSSLRHPHINSDKHHEVNKLRKV